MGTEVYVVCVKCKKVHAMGRWAVELPEAIVKGSKAVEYVFLDKTEEWERKKAYQFAQEHTDKGHEVIVAYEG